MGRKNCSHCRGAEYVPVYWFERVLEQNGIHMTEIPPSVFKKIPLEFLCYCHCNFLVTHIPGNNIVRCLECEGTTWQFSETAEQNGYRWKKFHQSAWSDLKDLPCDYFERCPCYDEQSFKHPQKKKALTEILELLKVQISNFGFVQPWRA